MVFQEMRRLIENLYSRELDIYLPEVKFKQKIRVVWVIIEQMRKFDIIVEKP